MPILYLGIFLNFHFSAKYTLIQKQFLHKLRIGYKERKGVDILIKRGWGLIIAATFLLVLLASCSNGAKSTEDSPLMWIIYNNERYEEAQVYESKPDGLISTNVFTDEDDYAPNKEIFIDPKTSMLYIQEGTEWERFVKK